MSGRSRRKAQRTLVRAVETALDVAVGGPALAADEAAKTLDRMRGRIQDAAQGSSRDSPTDVAGTAPGGSYGRPYEERTRDDLYELATRRGIAGRSAMRKSELIAALRSER